MASRRQDAAQLQQGVAVRVLSKEHLRRAWEEFRRNEYEPAMDRVAGCCGVIQFQHPSGAFTVSFSGKSSGLRDGEELRFKLPPLALEPAEAPPPPAPKCDSPAPPPAAPVTPAEPSGSPPPPFAAEQRGLDDCLEPPELHDPEVKRAVRGESPEPGGSEEDQDDDEDEEEAAFLQALEEEEAAAEAEEAAFLEELAACDDNSSSSSSSSKSSRDSSGSSSSSSCRSGRSNSRASSAAAPAPPIEDQGDAAQRATVVYEPHDRVADQVVRFGEGRLKDKSVVDPAHLVRPSAAAAQVSAAPAGSPRSQVIYEDRIRVSDIMVRYAEQCG